MRKRRRRNENVSAGLILVQSKCGAQRRRVRIASGRRGFLLAAMPVSFRFPSCALWVLLTCIGLAPVHAQFSDKLLTRSGLWDDGKAEVAVFTARENRNGRLHEADVRHILMRENTGTDATIKLHQTLIVPVGSIRYDQSHSAFWSLQDGRLTRFASATDDATGLSYQQGDLIAAARNTWRYRAFVDQPGTDETDVTVAAPPQALAYDELPFKLRLLDWGKVTLFEAPLLPSVIGAKRIALDWKPAAFAVQRTPDGWRVTVTHERGTDRLTFDRGYPHALRHWLRWDGSSLERKHLIRIPYGELDQPGDERYLAPGATYP